MTVRVCPFCGGAQKQNKEHVWAKWLHALPGAQTLLQGSNGKRIPNPFSIVQLSESNRYESELQPNGHWAQVLPDVQVNVCCDCNSTWMSGLETEAKRLVGRLIFDAEAVLLSAADQVVLAAWATEMFMAYALTKGPIANPFSEEQYREIAATHRQPSGMRVWMAHVASRFSQVGMAINPWLGGAEFDPVKNRDNAALGYVAVGGLVFLLVIAPQADANLEEAMAPPRAGESPGATDITDPRDALQLNTPQLGEEYMQEVLAWLDIPRLISMPPVEGMTPADLDEAVERFRTGMPLAAIRAAYPGSHTESDAGEALRCEERALAEADKARRAGDPVGAGLILTQRGRIHCNNGDFEGARRLLEAAIDIPGSGLRDDAEAFYRVGQCLWNLRDPQCEDWYLKAIELGLDAPEPRFGIVDLRIQSGRYRDALAMIEEIDPETDRQSATQLVAGNALQFLVDELGLSCQEVREVSLTGEEPLSPEAAIEILSRSNATNRLAWLSAGTDERVQFHFAKAWFGDDAFSWIAITLAIADSDPDGARSVFRLGLERVPALFEAADIALDALEVGAPGHEGIEICRAILSDLRTVS